MSNTTSEYPDDVVNKQDQDVNLQEEDQLTLRALVSTKEAGVIIGKGGKNVAELRESTGVKAGVSKVVQGVHDRVLTVSGTLEGVAKAYSLIARTMLENPISTTATTTTTTTTTNNASTTSPTPANTINPVVTLRLLISHNLMGTVIGRQGAKIKHIQDISGVRMTASKALLPQSTERVVEVRGTVSAIQQAVAEIGQCLIEDKDRAYGTILYNPSKVTTTANAAGSTSSISTPNDLNHNNSSNNNHRRSSITRTGNGSDFSTSVDYNGRRASFNNNNNNNNNNSDVRTQHISIPSDMVGCIIGKGGSKISEIRQLSGSHISIAKVPHDESGERMFTIQGTSESNERALYLLYGQLENEKERRLRGVMQEDPLLEDA
ncbi:uncharacterized protein EV154DRAFT_546107 [Mucor mucedo]|uniref:uncharacterized protein n=1 Tax=Mucor mucedo TaxID=29922 RepID=UPI00221EDDC2|nr:uncharacterized protein EV154DRAFT_546107 [Mucor mucedo]KAI7873290.1 hypothetical protein EV154DRAFT_546107 [Mucor mucedo]